MCRYLTADDFKEREHHRLVQLQVNDPLVKAYARDAEIECDKLSELKEILLATHIPPEDMVVKVEAILARNEWHKLMGCEPSPGVSMPSKDKLLNRLRDVDAEMHQFTVIWEEWKRVQRVLDEQKSQEVADSRSAW